LQFRLRDAGSELGRFLLHSLIGLLDRIHPETTAPLAAGSEDFGRTLESFGIGSGFYLVLPVVGPSSLRDGIGMVTGLYLEPSPHLFNLRRCTWYDVEEKSLLGHLKAYQAIRKESLDPYLSIRNAYAQQRESSGKETFSLSGGAGRASAERVANLKVSDPG
jgi:phospholipid-binding lipoprotein MlaA